MEGALRHSEKRRRHSGEEMVMMRRKRSRQDWRLKQDEKIPRSPEQGTVERWKSSRREKARYLEFSGSEDETVRQRGVRMEKGGLERDVGMRCIGENEDEEQERFHNILPEIFLIFSLRKVSQYFDSNL